MRWQRSGFLTAGRFAVCLLRLLRFQVEEFVEFAKTAMLLHAARASSCCVAGADLPRSSARSWTWAAVPGFHALQAGHAPALLQYALQRRRASACSDVRHKGPLLRPRADGACKLAMAAPAHAHARDVGKRRPTSLYPIAGLATLPHHARRYLECLVLVVEGLWFHAWP